MSKIIVVVDDDAAILKLVELILRRFQYTVMTFDNPTKVFDTLNSITPDLFILDVMMPQMSGVELSRQLRLHPHGAHTPIIMVSAMNDIPDHIKGLGGEADAFLSKKMMHRELASYVHQLLNRAINRS